MDSKMARALELRAARETGVKVDALAERLDRAEATLAEIRAILADLLARTNPRKAG